MNISEKPSMSVCRSALWLVSVTYYSRETYFISENSEMERREWRAQRHRQG